MHRVNTDIITARALYETGETERALEIMRKYFDQYPTACASVYLETLIKAGKLERATAVTEILAYGSSLRIDDRNLAHIETKT